MDGLKDTPTRYISVEEWETYRPLLSKLYLEDGKTLPEIKKILARNYGVSATYHIALKIFCFPILTSARDFMFKSRFKKWELLKNYKGSDVEKITKAKAQDEALGIRKPYVINNRSVDPVKLNRSMKRRQQIQRQKARLRDETTQHQSFIRSLSGSHIASLTAPTQLYLAESIIFHVSSWTYCLFGTSTLQNLSRNVIIIKKRPTKRWSSGATYLALVSFTVSAELACDSFQESRILDGGRHLNDACSHISSILCSNSHMIVWALWEAVQRLWTLGFDHFAMHILHFSVEMARVKLPSEFPLRRLMELLSSMELPDLADLIPKALEAQAETFWNILYQEILKPRLTNSIGFR